MHRRLLAFLRAFWLSFLHTCHRMAQRGLAAAVQASLKRLSRGLLACRWCWVTRAWACRTQMEARRVAAAWTLTKKHNTTATVRIQAGRVPESLQSQAEELKWSGNYERRFKGPVWNILAGFLSFILVTAQHIAHEYCTKSTYVLHNKSNMVFLAFRKFSCFYTV